MNKSKYDMTPSEWAASELRSYGVRRFYTVREATPKVLRKAAARTRQIEVWFAKHPQAWIQGEAIERRDSDLMALTGEAFGVCFVGAMWNAPMIGLKLEPLNGVRKAQMVEVAEGVIEANDDAPTLAHFRMFARHYADVLDAYAENPGGDQAWKDACYKGASKITKRHLQVQGYRDRNKQSRSSSLVESSK